MIVSFLIVFFFFSSRRRHTRSLRDWSSDVCSSDLGARTAVLRRAEADGRQGTGHLLHRRRQAAPALRVQGPQAARDRKSTRLNSSHVEISYAVLCLKKKSLTYSEIRFGSDK